MITALDHVGIAVPNSQKLLQIFQSLLGLRHLSTDEVPHEGVRVYFLGARSAKIEILEATKDDSPVARFLEKRTGGLHHIAFDVPDIEAAMVKVKEAGLTTTRDHWVVGAGGKRIFFVHPRDTSGVLVEFCQKPPSSPSIYQIGPEAVLSSLGPHARTPHLHSIASVPPHSKGLVIHSGHEASEALAYPWNSLVLHVMGPFVPPDPPTLIKTSSVLISGSDTFAEDALRLRHYVRESTLCILPVSTSHPSGVDPRAWTPVLVKHFSL